MEYGYRPSASYRAKGPSEKFCMSCGNKLGAVKDHFYYIGFCNEKCKDTYMGR